MDGGNRRAGNSWVLWTLGLLTLFAGLLYLYIRSNRKTVTMATGNTNVQAFLKMIRYAEGTAGPNGYRTLFGGKTFSDTSKHPNIKVPFRDTYSTAAGAYQILYRTWAVLKARLNLPDFSPESQDRAAIELIREKGALEDVTAGRFAVAVNKIRKIWASMPGAGYNQPEKSLAALQKVYTNAGGNLA